MMLVLCIIVLICASLFIPFSLFNGYPLILVVVLCCILVIIIINTKEYNKVRSEGGRESEHKGRVWVVYSEMWVRECEV